MLRNGKYTVWYRTERGEGVGVVTFDRGRIFGGDTWLEYNGSFEQDGDRFQAKIRTHRHTDGSQPSVFGIDEVDLVVKGKSSAGIIASCTGRAKQAPDLAFEATLIRIAD